MITQDSSSSFVIHDLFDRTMKVEVSIELILFDLTCSLVGAVFEYHVLQECQLM